MASKHKIKRGKQPRAKPMQPRLDPAHTSSWALFTSPDDPLPYGGKPPAPHISRRCYQLELQSLRMVQHRATLFYDFLRLPGVGPVNGVAHSTLLVTSAGFFGRVFNDLPGPAAPGGYGFRTVYVIDADAEMVEQGIELARDLMQLFPCRGYRLQETSHHSLRFSDRPEDAGRRAKVFRLVRDDDQAEPQQHQEPQQPQNEMNAQQTLPDSYSEQIGSNCNELYYGRRVGDSVDSHDSVLAGHHAQPDDEHSSQSQQQSQQPQQAQDVLRQPDNHPTGPCTPRFGPDTWAGITLVLLQASADQLCEVFAAEQASSLCDLKSHGLKGKGDAPSQDYTCSLVVADLLGMCRTQDPARHARDLHRLWEQLDADWLVFMGYGELTRPRAAALQTPDEVKEIRDRREERFRAFDADFGRDWEQVVSGHVLEADRYAVRAVRGNAGCYWIVYPVDEVCCDDQDQEAGSRDNEQRQNGEDHNNQGVLSRRYALVDVVGSASACEEPQDLQ